LKIKKGGGQEIKESIEMVQLILKGDWGNKKVKEQAIDLLKMILFIGIFIMPGGSFILFLLDKALGEGFFLPSAFKE